MNIIAMNAIVLITRLLPLAPISDKDLGLGDNNRVPLTLVMLVGTTITTDDLVEQYFHHRNCTST